MSTANRDKQGDGQGPAQPTVVAVPIDEHGWVGPWGRAHRVALAKVQDGAVTAWEELEVGWDALHDTGSEAAHHARVARFVKQHGVQVVAAAHMGRDMQAMLERMHLRVSLGNSGDGHHAALVAGQGPATP